MMCYLHRPLLLVSILLIFIPAFAVHAEVTIGRFDSAIPAPPSPWQVIRLEKSVPPTAYRVIRWDGIEAIEAQAKSSMALLGRPVEINLAETPILCWRWRIDHVLKKADIKKRHGDDYAARIYLAFSLPPESLSFGDRAALALVRSLYDKQVPDAALNYVWDNLHAVGERLPNAYTDRAQMIVQRSGNAEADKWVQERVNVRNDVTTAFGSSKARILLLAVAADSDNTGETVRSGFAEIHFVRAEESCHFSEPFNAMAN